MPLLSSGQLGLVKNNELLISQLSDIIDKLVIHYRDYKLLNVSIKK